MVNDMINVADLQNVYVNLYKQLRKYIWNFSVVEDIADLEISVYQACPNMTNVGMCFRQVRTDVYEVEREDEDLKKALDKFQEVLDSGTETFFKLTNVREVVPA